MPAACAGLWVVNLAAPARWYGSWGGAVGDWRLYAEVGNGYFRFPFAYQMNFEATSEGLTTTLRSKHKM